MKDTTSYDIYLLQRERHLIKKIKDLHLYYLINYMKR